MHLQSHYTYIDTEHCTENYDDDDDDTIWKNYEYVRNIEYIGRGPTCGLHTYTDNTHTERDQDDNASTPLPHPIFLPDKEHEF
jgi:hypothetical protein